MKLAIVVALLGTAAVSATEQSATLRGAPAASEFVYAPPPATESSSLASLWDELASEASFMQVQIAEGRTRGQCMSGCNNKNFNGNRARCRKNCDQIRDQGNDTDRRSFSCGDCRSSFPDGGRRYDRCIDACRENQSDQVQNCKDANNCGQCIKYCGTGNILDKCLDDFNCPGSDRRSNRDCWDARTCGECNSFCDDRDDRLDCRDDLDCSAAKEAAEEEIAKKLAEMIHKKE